MNKPYQVKRMAVLDLSGLLKLRYHTSLMVASNEQTEYNMLMEGSNIEMELKDDRPINSVDRIMDVGKINR